MWTSVPQIEVRRIRIRTSLAPGTGTGTSVSSTPPGPGRTLDRAFIIFGCMGFCLKVARVPRQNNSEAGFILSCLIYCVPAARAVLYPGLTHAQQLLRTL